MMSVRLVWMLGRVLAQNDRLTTTAGFKVRATVAIAVLAVTGLGVVTIVLGGVAVGLGEDVAETVVDPSVNLMELAAVRWVVVRIMATSTTVSGNSTCTSISFHLLAAAHLSL